jgi:hypothetical protein
MDNARRIFNPPVAIVAKKEAASADAASLRSTVKSVQK